MHFKDLPPKHRGERTKSQTSVFFKLIATLNVMCQFFGVAPILDSPREKRHVLRCFHYIWCAIFVIYIYGVNVYYAYQPHEALVNIVKLFFISELFSNPIIVSLIVITTHCHAEKYHHIPRELLRIHRHYKSLQPANARIGKDLFSVLQKEVRLLLFIVCPFLLCCLIVDCMRTHPDFVHWLLSLSIFHLPNILISLNLGQYWLALRFLCRLYRGFNQILKQRLQQISSSDLSGGVETNAGDTCASEFFWYPREFYNTHHPGGVNDECKLLKAIRGSYGDLDALRAQLTSLFGLVLLLIFLGSLLSLTVECFAVYKFLDCDNATANELATVYQRLLNILIHIGRIFLILVTNNAIIEEKCQTSFTLNELHITSEEMEHEVNRFLIQLMLHQPAEMVCGIVDLDLLALGGIGGIMANYVIFLIQIDLGNINMDENNQNIAAIPGDRFSL